ncbi:hypothetical protein [Niabella drilacis]|uniref:Uncharacterized protein n=1 Tax=Niabella drilacis (strain DSM 25811 / CCM 8410 / CCUG 62505 / LMG 26954 / E90) TaxID=1285928 RepID=A0A1G6V7F7_NIADE|nr:hypothetical protein [Niabella drilacis]SDD48937.1 hypothetical protein SAMN04487894_109204 [Niabella drilacis]
MRVGPASGADFFCPLVTMGSVRQGISLERTRNTIFKEKHTGFSYYMDVWSMMGHLVGNIMIMKREIVLIAFVLLPALTFSQYKSIEKLVNGKPCDTCEVKYYMQTGNTLEYAFIGGRFNSNRLSAALNELKRSAPNAAYEQRCYVTRDSVIEIAFLDNRRGNPYPMAQSVMWGKNFDYSFMWKDGFDYKNIRVRTLLNNKQVLNDTALTDLKPVKDFIINDIKYDQETGDEKVTGTRGNYSTGRFALNVGDVVTVTLFNTKIKKEELRLYIKRVFDSPTGFFYYEVPFKAVRACLNFIDVIYYEAILERNKENFAGIVGHYGEKFNAVAAQNSHNKAIE